MKAEELKQLAKIPNDTILAVMSVVADDETEVRLEKRKKYRFTEEELQQYVDEVSREEVLKWHKAIADFLGEINKQIQTKKL